ncbi:CDP-2,3-bis-(O-geranylgeranyl)-sn-glycerol synthase [Candidatus Borrarchaeum sp.]|uniref:CDP-2,3-bis-(O-geranylgeranyl)-sn-glycerol synthase n=1 Tax=Candidatus Borrarchaeum sp. TaxID=2846742 RepID=UPI00257A5295|nr:CDP-2,3-bis-(O-geranylgeranyl)-sn-glycerol synthase [Candidatus Borrarchaeum sp.]
MALDLSLIMFLQAIWFILPAYAANGLPVLFGGGPPIDFGKTLNEKRIFGDGKTIRGFIGGVISGTLVGLTLFYVGPILNQSIPESQGLIELSYNPIVALLISVGALIGDLVGSFIKRRLNLKRGAPAPVLDQITFLVFAFLFALLIIRPIPLEYVIFLIPLTLGLHLFTNFISWLIGIKKVPY